MVNTPSNHEAPGENHLDATPVLTDVTGVSSDIQGKLNFAKYRGDLNADEYGRVMSSRLDQDDYGVAMRKLLPFGLPSHSTVEVAAKLITTLRGDQRLNNDMWIFAEAMCLDGKN